MKDMDVLFKVKKCSYVILDQRRIDDEAAKAVQRRFFLWWRAYWNEILQTVGIGHEIDPDEFYQQHKVTAILYEDEIISMHLLSIFDRSDFSSHPYFKKFDTSFIKGISALSVNKILTLQYLAFNPKYKKEKPFMYFPMTIGSLSMYHQQLENAQAIVSVARKDLGISNALAKMNFSCFQEDGVYNNTPVSYQISFEVKPYPSDMVKDLCLHFWTNKIDFNNEIIHKEVA